MRASDRERGGILDGAVLTVALATAHLGLAWFASEFAVLGTLSVWYAPAGLALATGTLLGWRALPGHAIGEVLVGVMLFGVVDDFGWLVVPNGVAYAGVYIGAGTWMRAAGGTAAHSDRRRPATILALGAFTVPLAGGIVGVGFQALAGIAALADAPRLVLVWALGDAVGVASIGITIVVVAVRSRRGGRWWALPDTSGPMTAVLVTLPGLLILGLSTIGDSIVPFTAAVFVPFVVLAVLKGVPAVALSAPITTLATTLIADGRFSDDVLAISDLQLMLLVMITTGMAAALVTEERQDMALRLEEQADHLERAQASARAGSFVWDVPDDTVRWSDGLHALYGVPVGPVTAADYIARVHPDDRDRVQQAIGAALETGEGTEHTYRALRADGTELIVRATLDVRSFDGRVVELVGTCTDITAEERARRRLEEAVEREQAARAAQEAVAAEADRVRRIKEALLVAVSHEVRTPLTLIRGLVETLRRSELAGSTLGENDAALASLDRHSVRLTRVLQDLLDVDRIGRGIVAPQRRSTDLRQLCENVVAGLDTRRRVAIEAPVGEVEVDSRLASRIVEHLLANAVRHTPEDADVRISCSLERDELHVEVIDGGPGIAAEDRERVFEPFEQGDVPAHAPGTGVGLFIVARFAELHGGRAWIEDTDGGARVHVVLATTDAAARRAVAPRDASRA